jgi:hypothetical protein
MGGPHSPSRGKIGRANPEIQAHHQGKSSVGMVMARRAKQGGMECTILVYIHTSAKGVSVQKRKYLHWITLEQTPNLNNEVVFAAPAHNLLVRLSVENTTSQVLRNRLASTPASPQAARKKRFTRLDMTILMNPEISSSGPAQGKLLEECREGELVDNDIIKPSGSICQPTARYKLTYV